MKLKILPCVTLLILLSACSTKQSNNSHEVTIGTQIWMTENLGVDYFRNGDIITQVKSTKEWKKAAKNHQPAWCYYKYNLENGATYGKLYNWYAVNDSRGLAPEGWHIPTDNEWKLLSNYLGGEDFAGKKMKSTSGWKDNNGNNSSGFNGLPGGFCSNAGYFDLQGALGCWWSASEGSTDSAYNRYLHRFNGNLNRGNFNKALGFSVRCLRD